MSWVRAPQATRCVLVCHGHDPCCLPDGEDMRSFPWHALTIREMARTMTMTRRTHRVAWEALTRDIPGQFSVLLLLKDEDSAGVFFVLNLHRCGWVWGRYLRVSWQRNMYEHHRKLHLYVCGRLHWRWTPNVKVSCEAKYKNVKRTTESSCNVKKNI